jgi:hypothetical protein
MLSRLTKAMGLNTAIGPTTDMVPIRDSWADSSLSTCITSIRSLLQKGASYCSSYAEHGHIRDMMTPFKTILLDMLSTARPVSRFAFGDLTADDWAAMTKVIRQHRLGPILDHRCRSRGGDWPIPEHIRTEWADGFRACALRSLRIQLTLAEIAGCLKKAGIEFVVLKGGWLAWHAYPHAALRPMRDIDVWVGPERAIRAQEALYAAGFVTDSEQSVSLKHAAEHAKHLPPLLYPKHNIAVEIHARIYYQNDLHPMPDSGDNATGLMQRKLTLPIARVEIGYLAPTDTLLHLIVHGIYDHHLSNGPVLLDDIAFLLASHEISWSHFWQSAEQHGLSNGCYLAFDLVEFQHGLQPIKWPDSKRVSVPDEIRLRALELCLQDFDTRATTAVYGDVNEGGAFLSLFTVVRRRFAIWQHVVADHTGMSPRNPLLWLMFPVWLLHRAFRTARQLLIPSVRHDVAQSAAVSKWLAGHRA